MKAGHNNLKKLIVIGSASVFTLLAVPLMSDVAFNGNASLVATAQAAEDGHSHTDSGHSGGKGGSANKGGQKKGQGGSHESAAGGASKSVEVVVTEEDSGKKGPAYKGGGTDRTRGKPAWAQEGIPEVELGRLNVARAPGKVMDKQLVEALAALKTLVAADGTSIYEASSAVEAASLIVADALRIDSPLANLALIKDFLNGGIDGFVPTMSSEDFVSILLAGASDKTLPISSDTVVAIEKILGVEMGDDAYVATTADDVREAILFAHDN